MGKVLEEMLSRTANNRIEDPDEAGRIMTALAQSSLGELSRDMVNMGASLLKFVSLPTESAYELSLGELLGMLRILCCEGRTSDFAARLKITLFEQSAGSVRVRLFKAVTLGAFAKFVDSSTATLRGSAVYNRVSRIAEEDIDLRIQREMTFGQLFNSFGYSMTNWNTCCPLSCFVRRSEACSKIIKLLMVDCFRFVFGEMFLLGALENKVSGQRSDAECSHDQRVSCFGDEYDTEADEFFWAYGRAPSFTMSEEEKEEWRKVTARLRRIREWQKSAEEWDRIRYRLLKLTGSMNRSGV